jgi:adenosine deaminase
MSEFDDWVRALPKAELHVHLEGTITPLAYRRIAQRNGVPVAEDISSLYRCHDFPSFLSAFLTVVKVLQQPEDFAELTTAYLAQCAADGVRHVELMLSPATLRHFHASVDLVAIVAAIHAAREDALASHGLSSVVIFDMVRNLGSAAAFRDIELALECRDYGVVGVGLGGDEANFPARDFGDAFAAARKAGLRRTVHAGEAAGADSIQEAVTLCHAERIGHGVAAAHSPETMRLLRERDVAVDACLTSNDVTGVWNTYHAHPIVRFVNDEVPATLNSDDPAFFGASLCDEYARAADAGLTRAALAQLAGNSFRYSFAPDAAKRRWLAELDQFTAAHPV